MHAGVVAIDRNLRAGAAFLAVLSLAPAGVGRAAPVENCLPRETRDDRTAVLSGTSTDDAEWVAAFGVDDRDIQLVCVRITVDGEQATRGVLGGPFDAAANDDEIVVSVLTTGFRFGPRWHVLRGTVTDAADRVELSIDGADPVEAEIADAGPEDGWHWYAVVVSAPEQRGFPHVSAVAYDADGELIADGESPF